MNVRSKKFAGIMTDFLKSTNFNESEFTKKLNLKKVYDLSIFPKCFTSFIIQKPRQTKQTNSTLNDQVLKVSFINNQSQKKVTDLFPKDSFSKLLPDTNSQSITHSLSANKYVLVENSVFKNDKKKQISTRKIYNQEINFLKQKRAYVPYSKIPEMHFMTIGLANSHKIRYWAEKKLPNQKILGQVISANTLHHKTFKPLKGGLFCERIFGPIKDFECACGNRKKPTQLESQQIIKHQQIKRKFCPVCDVEYTWSILRRYQMGYIQLVAPVTHVWYLKGKPSYLSILLEMKRRSLESIIYCSKTLTLENSSKMVQQLSLSSTPVELFEAWKETLKQNNQRGQFNNFLDKNLNRSIKQTKFDQLIPLKTEKKINSKFHSNTINSLRAKNLKSLGVLNKIEPLAKPTSALFKEKYKTQILENFQVKNTTFVVKEQLLKFHVEKIWKIFYKATYQLAHYKIDQFLTKFSLETIQKYNAKQMISESNNRSNNQSCCVGILTKQQNLLNYSINSFFDENMVDHFLVLFKKSLFQTLKKKKLSVTNFYYFSKKGHKGKRIKTPLVSIYQFLIILQKISRIKINAYIPKNPQYIVLSFFNKNLKSLLNSLEIELSLTRKKIKLNNNLLNPFQPVYQTLLENFLPLKNKLVSVSNSSYDCVKEIQFYFLKYMTFFLQQDQSFIPFFKQIKEPLKTFILSHSFLQHLRNNLANHLFPILLNQRLKKTILKSKLKAQLNEFSSFHFTQMGPSFFHPISYAKTSLTFKATKKKDSLYLKTQINKNHSVFPQTLQSQSSSTFFVLGSVVINFLKEQTMFNEFIYFNDKQKLVFEPSIFDMLPAVLILQVSLYVYQHDLFSSFSLLFDLNLPKTALGQLGIEKRLDLPNQMKLNQISDNQYLRQVIFDLKQNKTKIHHFKEVLLYKENQVKTLENKVKFKITELLASQTDLSFRNFNSFLFLQNALKLKSPLNDKKYIFIQKNPIIPKYKKGVFLKKLSQKKIYWKNNYLFQIFSNYSDLFIFDKKTTNMELIKTHKRYQWNPKISKFSHFKCLGFAQQFKTRQKMLFSDLLNSVKTKTIKLLYFTKNQMLNEFLFCNKKMNLVSFFKDFTCAPNKLEKTLQFYFSKQQLKMKNSMYLCEKTTLEKIFFKPGFSHKFNSKNSLNSFHRVFSKPISSAIFNLSVKGSKANIIGTQKKMIFFNDTIQKLQNSQFKGLEKMKKNFVKLDKNHIYCLSSRRCWGREKSWQYFSAYYLAPRDFNDFSIPIYNFSNILSKNIGGTGASMIQKFLSELNFNELKKMEQLQHFYIIKLTKKLIILKKLINDEINEQNRKDDIQHLEQCFEQREQLRIKSKLLRKFLLAAGDATEVQNDSLNFSGALNKTVTESNSQNSLTNGIILTVLPVLPTDLRPILKMQDQIAASDLNRLYQRVIYRNDRLKKFLKDPAMSYSFEIKYAQRLLQEAVDNLIQNGKSGVVPERDSRDRPLKSLSDILKGKQGRFRQNLLGKRVDYSGRSVIVVGPKLKIHECGLPKEIALELYLPFLIQRILDYNFAKTIVGAKTLLKTNPNFTYSLLSELMQNYPVFLNRAPTLHRLGIQAFQPRLIDGRAILLHPLVCPAFNADFDGDQMAVHLPLTLQARSEAWKLMFSRNHLISSATGDPIMLPSQDMVLGCYYLTTEILTKNLSSYKTEFFSTVSSLIMANICKQKATKLKNVQKLLFKNDLLNQIFLCVCSFEANKSNRNKAQIFLNRTNHLKKVYPLNTKENQYFNNFDQVMKAYQLQLLSVHSNIWVKCNKQIETALTKSSVNKNLAKTGLSSLPSRKASQVSLLSLQKHKSQNELFSLGFGRVKKGLEEHNITRPIEIQLDSAGFWQVVRQGQFERFDKQNVQIQKYIRTTPGRVFLDKMLHKFLSS